MASAAYEIPKVECRRRLRRHEHDAARRVPRRGPARGDRGDRAGDRPLRRRDRPGPGRGPPQEPDPAPTRSRTRPPPARSYDCGDYEKRARPGARRAGYADLRAEQRAPARGGDATQLGIGLCVYVEITDGVRRAPSGATVEVTADGGARVRTGLGPTGQGHHTAWRCSSPTASASRSTAIEVIHGDTDLVPRGHRHLRLALAAGRRRGDQRRGDQGRRQGQGARRGRARGERRPTSCSTPTAASSTSPAPRPDRLVGGARGLARRRRPPRRARASRTTSSRRRRPSRSAPTSRSSRSTPRPAR